MRSGGVSGSDTWFAAAATLMLVIVFYQDMTDPKVSVEVGVNYEECPAEHLYFMIKNHSRHTIVSTKFDARGRITGYSGIKNRKSIYTDRIIPARRSWSGCTERSVLPSLLAVEKKISAYNWSAENVEAKFVRSRR